MNALLSRAAQPFGEFLLVFVPCLPLKSQSAALYSVQAPRPPAPVIHPYYTTEYTLQIINCVSIVCLVSISPSLRTADSISLALGQMVLQFVMMPV